MAATTNPVAYTYTDSNQKNTGSTKDSIPHPGSISKSTYTIAGIQTTVYGLEELPDGCTDVSVLWLLHPRLQTHSCMAPFASHFIKSWIGRHPETKASPCRGLIAVSFDQRNHGTREVSAITNEAWRSGNETHAQDMFSCYHGTAADTSLLLDYLAAYIFPHAERHVTQNIVMGISLGGHAAWHVLMHDSRFSAAVVVIGCPDYERLMADRARLSKRKTWTETEGRDFVGSKDFPRGLVESVRRNDPAGLLFSQFDDAKRSSGHHMEKLSQEERGKLAPLMARTLGNKRILNLSGGSDKLVPYAMSKPFLDWLKMSIGKGGFFEGGGLHLEDVVVPGAKHEVPPEMVAHMDRFIMETLEGGSADIGGIKTARRGSRI